MLPEFLSHRKSRVADLVKPRQRLVSKVFNSLRIQYCQKDISRSIPFMSLFIYLFLFLNSIPLKCFGHQLQPPEAFP
jgi:hypothetical protein